MGLSFGDVQNFQNAEELDFIAKYPDTLVKSMSRIIDNISYLSIWKAIKANQWPSIRADKSLDNKVHQYCDNEVKLTLEVRGN